MKRQKKQLLIWGILLVLVILGLGCTKLYNRKQEKKQAQEETDRQARLQLFTLAESSINSIRYTYDGETIDLIKEDDTWKLTSDSEASVSTTMTSNMTGKLMSFCATQILEDVTDLEQYGLAEGYETITVTTDDGESHTVYVGDWSSINSSYYVMLADQPSVVYMMSSDYINPFQKTIASLTDV